MKIKKQTVTETEVEITLPYFLKMDSGTYVAYLNEDKTLIVRDNSIDWYSQFMENYICDAEHIEITAEEFTRRFDRIVEHLNSFKSQFFNQPK